MVDKIYLMECKHFTREKIGDEWRRIPDKTERRCISKSLRNEMHSVEERDFWVGIGAKYHVYGSSNRSEISYICSVSPDGLSCRDYDFTEFSINTRLMGVREREALAESVGMREYPIIQNSAAHLVVMFGKETVAFYDLFTGTWS